MTAKTNTATKTEASNATADAKKYPTTEQMIKDGMATKSARIRHLHSLGMATGDIARQECDGLYQHAYNVIKKPLKKVEAKESATASTDTSSKEPAASAAESKKEVTKA